MRLSIYNLPPDVTEQEVQEYFAGHGAEVQASIKEESGVRLCDIYLDADPVITKMIFGKLNGRYFRGQRIVIDVPLVGQPPSK